MADRIVISGRGLVTPIGNGLAENTASLKAGRSGIVFMPEWKDLGMETLVAGVADRNVECPVMNVKNKRFMSPNSIFAVAAAYEAITEAGFTMETLPRDTMALINGCAGSSYDTVHTNSKTYEETHRLRRVSPFAVPRIMPSSAVANMSLIFCIRGESYDISAACTSSALAIITGVRLLMSGEYDYVLVGGSEEVSWEQAIGFGAMHALSTKYSDAPSTSSRPFDKSRDGFVLGEGAGMLVLERESTCLARGVKPKATVSGYASNSNGVDMVIPDSESTCRVMRKALEMAHIGPSDISYINTHGTATGVGDPMELNAIKEVFGTNGTPVINSTKSMTGHMIGAAGSVETIFTTLMMENSFVCPTANLKDPEDGFAWADLVRGASREGVEIKHALSNSFGFGGSNATLILSKYE